MITYSKIEPCDYAALTACMREAFDDDTRMHTSLLADGPYGYADGSLIRKLNAREECISEKICINGEIAGAYTVIPGKEEYTLELLFLHPKFKNRGAGQNIWKHIEDSYPAAEAWILETPAYSKRNQHFYEKCGFCRTGEKNYGADDKSFCYRKQR